MFRVYPSSGEVDVAKQTPKDRILLVIPYAWKRDETTATAGQLMVFNGITAEALCKRGLELIK
jgi:hypothetical protein